MKPKFIFIVHLRFPIDPELRKLATHDYGIRLTKYEIHSKILNLNMNNKIEKLKLMAKICVIKLNCNLN